MVDKCVVCKRHRGKLAHTTPIQLPVDRVRDAAVFKVVGIDLAGPLYVKTGEKIWRVLFTCAVYRAVHLEIVSSLSTVSFLQSLRGFKARRGRSQTIYNDNGTNFAEAENAFQRLNWRVIGEEDFVQRIDWKFNPPTASLLGGWFERLIRMLKNFLKKELEKAHLSLDDLNTILRKCECILNSRLLTYMSEDSSDLATLTPKMFLQEVIESVTLDLDRVEAIDMRKRYLYRVKLKENLKKRFRGEYLGQLKLFSIKGNKQSNLNVGDIVFVINDNQKNVVWGLGRISKLIPSRDGNVRLAELKTSSGLILRPIKLPWPLFIVRTQG